ncbi:MAG TPA: glycoside hydrolase family 2 protein [Terriglobia bacterium]|nr:glycoside hydrolase family 2 protein [Terriglobia bacterium]
MKKVIFAFLTITLIAGMSKAIAASQPESRINLKDGWAIQSSAKVAEKGEALSTAGYQSMGWYPTTIPSTVVAALVRDKVYPDPYFGMNLRSIPGTSYPIGQNFANLEMPPDSPFRSSWWYRTSFTLPKTAPGRHLWLHFDGINYRANVWLNGRRIANSAELVGMWRLFELDITGTALAGQKNALAVEIFPPQPNDLALTWVDWNPLPADKDMGIWRNVYVTTSGPVTLSYPRTITHFDLPSLDTAHLTVVAEAHNATDQPVTGTLSGQIGTIKFSQPVQLGASETKLVTFAPEAFPQLNIANPRVWWPAKLGGQPLYDLHLQFNVGKTVSDQVNQKFGIRQVTSELTDQGYRLFKINGKNILIRGGGWAPDMMLRPSPERDEAQLRYVLGMNLNAIRFEGKLESEEFLSLCDKYGILVMAGWCCCDHWEKWKSWKTEDYTVASESLRDQLQRLGAHPSVFDWLYGSDNPPPPDVEASYLKVIKETLWPNPYQSSATARPTKGLGKTGVKMNGPYEYVSSDYWEQDTKNGGGFGFSTEISPGPAVPPVASLRLMLPANHLWPIDDYWNFHTGGGEFKTIDVFTTALERRYGKAENLDDYAEKSQLMTYEGERAMFEAYGRNKYTSTGVIQWMLNNAWPSLIWHLFDYYLRPAGGYFGTQKACEPLHVQYSYDDRSVVVVNSLYQEFKNFNVTAKVYNLDLTPKFSREARVDIGPDSSNRVFEIPQVADLSTTYFVQLRLEDHFGQLVSSNFYWLSTQPDVQDWDNTQWYCTPVKSYADFTSLKDLPRAGVKVSGKIERQGKDQVAQVTVENPSAHLAFFVHLQVANKQGGDEVLPVLWQDNYFELMPGESRKLSATFMGPEVLGAGAVVEADGWNVPPASAALAAHQGHAVAPINKQ